jgi:hypothetical protein
MQPRELESWSRSELIERAEALAVPRASVLTRAELIDEIVRRTVQDPVERRLARGLLGIARDLVARVVERGLHLPEAAALIRGKEPKTSWGNVVRAPIATVTLAEIYAAQGHKNRAISVLNEVLQAEPEHEAASSLRDRIATAPEVTPPLVPEGEETAVDQAVQELAAAVEGEALEGAAGAGVEGEALEETAARVNGGAVHEETAAHVNGGAVLKETAARGDGGAVHEEAAARADEIVLVSVDERTAHVRWAVREETLGDVRSGRAGGQLVLRVLAVTPSWSGPILDSRDIEVSELAGDFIVRELPEGAILRAAVGLRSSDVFEPLSVADEPGTGGAAATVGRTADAIAWTALGASTVAIRESALAVS